jgi:hypothetical protein
MDKLILGYIYMPNIKATKAAIAAFVKFII